VASGSDLTWGKLTHRFEFVQTMTEFYRTFYFSEEIIHYVLSRNDISFEIELKKFNT